MRLDINFTDYPTQWINRLGILSIVVNAILFCVIIYIMYLGDGVDAKVVELSQQKNALVKKYATLKDDPGANFAVEKYRQLQTSIKRINDIVDNHKYNVSNILAILESIIPPQVIINHFEHNSKSGEVTIKAVSAHSKQLTKFLKKLEKDKVVKSALLVRQNKMVVNDALLLQFEIILTFVV